MRGRAFSLAARRELLPLSDQLLLRRNRNRPALSGQSFFVTPCTRRTVVKGQEAKNAAHGAPTYGTERDSGDTKRDPRWMPAPAAPAPPRSSSCRPGRRAGSSWRPASRREGAAWPCCWRRPRQWRPYREWEGGAAFAAFLGGQRACAHRRAPAAWLATGTERGSSCGTTRHATAQRPRALQGDSGERAREEATQRTSYTRAAIPSLPRPLSFRPATAYAGCDGLEGRN